MCGENFLIAGNIAKSYYHIFILLNPDILAKT